MDAIESPKCPRFHDDNLKCRLVSTYKGPATQWLPHSLVNRDKLGDGNNGMPDEESGLFLKDTDIKELNTGVYLSNLHYLNWSDQLGGRVTGMTRYACFWVEDGEIISPIDDMRFDDTIYNFFGDKLESVTNKLRLNPSVGTYGGRNLGGVHCPGIILKSFELTL